MKEKRDRNTKQHQEGYSVNRESASFIFHILMDFTPKGERETTDFITMIYKIDLNSGSDPLL